MRTNYELRYASNPEDAKHYDTARLRRDFLIDRLFTTNEVNMVYSMYDRMIVGGAMPSGEELKLEAIDPLKALHFTTRREIGIYNVGEGEGTVRVGKETFELGFKEALYIGSGDRDVFFSSKDASKPAKFYFNSTTAHTSYPLPEDHQEGRHQRAHGLTGDVERAHHQQDDCQPGAAYLPAADGYDRAGHRFCVEHDAGTHPQPPHGGLLLF